MNGPRGHRLATKLALVALVLLATAPVIGASVAAQPSPTKPATGAGVKAAAFARSSQEGMYAYYYLWWDTQHWQTMLGANYPYGQSPLPLPAVLDAKRMQSEQPLQRQQGDRRTCQHVQPG
jgi:hypothetical protein